MTDASHLSPHLLSLLRCEFSLQITESSDYICEIIVHQLIEFAFFEKEKKKKKKLKILSKVEPTIFIKETFASSKTFHNTLINRKISKILKTCRVLMQISDRVCVLRVLKQAGRTERIS